VCASLLLIILLFEFQDCCLLLVPSWRDLLVVPASCPDLSKLAPTEMAGHHDNVGTKLRRASLATACHRQVAITQ